MRFDLFLYGWMDIGGSSIYARINVKLLGGRPGIGGAFELFKCLNPGHLWIVKFATKSQ